jgi:hypothetical protein
LPQKRILQTSAFSSPLLSASIIAGDDESAFEKDIDPDWQRDDGWPSSAYALDSPLRNSNWR